MITNRRLYLYLEVCRNQLVSDTCCYCKYSWCDSYRVTLSMLRLSLIARNSVSSSGIDSAKTTVVPLGPAVDKSMSDVVFDGTCVPFPRHDPIIIKMNRKKDERKCIYVSYFISIPN